MTPEKADQKIAELREATHTANQVLAEMKHAVKEMKQIRADIDKRFNEAFEDKVETQVADKLAEYKESIDTAIENSTQAVFDRFDQIGKMLLGETKSGKKSGPTVPEMVRDKAIRDRALYLQSVGPDEYPTDYYMDLAEKTLIKEGRIE